jgi:hypothetical protein
MVILPLSKLKTRINAWNDGLKAALRANNAKATRSPVKVQT